VENKCNHNCFDENNTLRIIPLFRYLGVLNHKKTALCICCKSNITINDDEFNNLLSLQKKD